MVQQPPFRDHRLMDHPSPGPWTFSEHMYGIAHCLIDRDGRVIGCNLPIGNGPPSRRWRWRRSSASSLPVPAEQLRGRAAQVLERIDAPEREPGEDDE